MTTTPSTRNLWERLAHSRWTVSATASGLILLSFLASTLGWTLTGDILMVAAALVAGARIAHGAVRALRQGSIGIDLLVTIAAIGAVFLRNYWEAAAVTTLFAIGHALEEVTLAKTRKALSDLVDSAPDRALVLRDGQEVDVLAGEVLPGETVIVKAGAVVPVDGEVLSGEAFVSEANITGESLPVAKSAGEDVYAGTVQSSGHLRVLAKAVGGETTLARIIRRVEDAQDEKAATQTAMERFSAWYTPGIILLAIISGLITRDLELALTLLVIGCPGALVISIPVAIVAGVGRGARDGVLIKGGEHLEGAASIDTIAFDKTGTLTYGHPQLTGVTTLNPELTDEDVLRFAASAEVGSGHPLAGPIVDAARASGLPIDDEEAEFQPVAGQGISVRTQGRHVVVGRPVLLAAEFPGLDVSAAEKAVAAAGEDGQTAMAVGVDGRIAGIVSVADTIRPDAAATIQRLRGMGIRNLVMLTGDRESVARSVARQVGVTDVRAGLMPEEKLEAIRALQEEGHRVAMVGDGVNDAPALATADAGIAMGAARNGLAVETADIALMGDRFDRLADALGLARRTVRVMRGNIAIAMVTVALLILGVYLGGVTMSIGMLVHEASVLVVIINAMRLLRRRETSHQGPTAAVESRVEATTVAA